MIARALVVSKADDSGYIWNVNIPILNGVPDKKEEAAKYQNLLNVKIENNSKLNKENQLTKEQIAKVVSEEWGSSNPKGKVESINSYYAKDFTGSEREFLIQAHICGIPGMQNLLHPGDIVYVGFENNDMGNPIILGHLLTKELEDARKEYDNYPYLKLESINIVNSATLPLDTKLNLGNKILNMSDLALLWNWYTSFTSHFGTINNLLDRLPKQET